MGGLDVSADTMDFVYLDVDTCGGMNAKTTHEIIAMTAGEDSDLKHVKTEIENIQQWKSNLFPDKIVYDTKSGEIMDPLKVEKGRLRELGLMNEHNMYELVSEFRTSPLRSIVQR